MSILYGLDISKPSATDPSEIAVEAERLGFDFVSANDHPAGTRPTYELWTLLTWVAARTRRIRIASRVLGVPYRSPPLVAKMAATLDGLSGGRLILGLGGGASDEEFRSFGMRVPTPREKIDGLGDAIRIMRALWTGDDVTVDGDVHRTERASIAPKPERPVPIWLGTYGPRALALTGEAADGWIPTLEPAPPERIPAMRDRIYRAAEAAGRDPAALTLVYNLDVRVDESARDEPGLLAGTPDHIVERIRGFAALGFSAFNLVPHGPDRAEQVARLAAEVIRG